jgi:hypothetical protein
MERTEQLQDFYDQNLHWDSQANDSLLIAEAAKDNCTFEEAASKLGSSLLIAPNFKYAWQDFLSAHPGEFDGPGCAGNMLVAFHHLPEHETQPTVAMFEEIASQGLLAKSNQYRQQQVDARERQQLILEISKGNSVYWSFDKWSRRASFQTSDLENKPLVELRELATKITEERRLQSLPTQQRRQEIRQITQDNKPPTAVRIKNPLPERYVCTVQSPYGYQVGQEVVLDTPVSFAKLGKEDQKILWLKHGTDALNALLKPELLQR